MFHNKLREARKKKKMTQLQVSIKLNISQSNLSKYEKGTLEPNLNTLKLFCKLYKVSADELLEINIEENK